MTQLAADNFIRANQSGWGTASDGNTWTVDSGAATQSIVSNQGKATGVTALTLIREGSTTSIDFDVTTRVSVNSANFTAAGIIARETGTTTCYRARLSSAANTFGIVKTIAGTTTNLSIPAFTPALNTEYWIRFKGVGSNLFAMIWADGSAVPTSWTATATDTSITTAGNVGLCVNTTNSADIALFDNFYAADYSNYEIQQLTTFAADATTTLTNSYTTTITEQLTTFDATISSEAGVQTITEPLTAFDAEATTTATVGFPTTPGVSVMMGGVPSSQQVMIREGSFDLDEQINQASSCNFTIRDDTGLNHYEKGQQVHVNDSSTGLMFTGVVNTSDEQNVRPNPLIFSKIAAQSNHWFPANRLYTGPEYVNQYAGAIAADLLNNLTSEGITAQYASRREITQTELGLGTLTNTVATSSNDGDIELSPAGTTVTATDSGLSLGSSPVLKFVGVAAQGTNTTFTLSRSIWSGSVALASGDYLTYDVWISSTSPEIKASIDFVFSDGTTLGHVNTSTGFPSQDQQGFTAQSSEDLIGFANDQWYSRKFTPLPTSKTISSVVVGFQVLKTGAYQAYFRHIKLWNAGNALKQTFFDTSLLNPGANVLIDDGFDLTDSANLLAVVNGYDGTIQATTGYFSLDNAKIARLSQINYVASSTTGVTTTVESTIDGGVTWQACTNHAAIPSLVPGMSVAGLNLQLRYTVTNTTTTPEITGGISNVGLSVTPGYNATKTDVSSITSNFSSGALTNLTGGASSLALTGAQRNYNDANTANQTLFGSGGPTQYVTAGQYYLHTSGAGNNDARARLDFTGTFTDFTCEVDFLAPNTLDAIGLFYLTNIWNSNYGSWAYAVTLYMGTAGSPSLYISRGTNTSGGGGDTTLGTVTLSMNAGTMHRLKVMYVSSTHTHKIYVDGTLYINLVDATYTAAGYLGYYYLNGQGVGIAGFALWDNFGVAKALSGTWVSPSVSIASVGTVNNSVIRWQQTQPDSTSVLVETSIDGGSTYQTATNNAAIPNLTAGTNTTGLSILARVTLTAVNASIVPTISGLSLLVSSTVNASGARISPALSLLTVGRLGSSLTAWNAVLPTNTALTVATSIDNGSTWQTATSGGTITGLLAQPSPTIDTFDSGESIGVYALRVFAPPVLLVAGAYTKYFFGVGAPIWEWDVANSRIIGSGAQDDNGVLLSNNPASFTDGYIVADLDEADESGMVIRCNGSTTMYLLRLYDDHATTGGISNAYYLYKVAAGTFTQLATGSITFTRGIPCRFMLSAIGTTISASMDGTMLASVTDSSIASGQAGLTACTLLRCYNIRIQPLGQDATAVSVLMKLTLTSTDPTATPQVLNTTLAAWGNTIASGALIPQTNYQYKYLSDAFGDLVKQSTSATGNQWWWDIDKWKIFSMLPQNGSFSPWIGTSYGSGDFLNDLTVTNQSDLYRNAQVITNVLATTTINENRLGDGVSRSWTFGNEWASAPTIMINGVPASVGVKNVDTGKDFYYAVGDATITEDSSGPLYDATQTINFSGVGQYLTYSRYDDTAEQAIFAELSGGSGIVENVEDGTGLTKAAGDALAQSRVQQYSIRGRVLKGTTRRSGLARGQLLSVFVPEYNVFDGLFLIRSIRTTLTTEKDPVSGNMIQHGWYQIEGIEGGDTGSWLKLFQRTT